MRDPVTPRVFVSYSRSDGLDLARRLHAFLAAEGLSLYRDLNDLEGGEDWWRQVEGAIRTVEHVVLVLSPAALNSPHVVREWKLARQEGKRISPVSGPDELDFSHLPRWMSRAHRHAIDIPESRERLVQVLKGPAAAKRVPFMADALPQGFIPRPELFERLKRSLLDSSGEPVAITAALRGAGGYGKTALASALCHDSDIQDAFGDGILRVTLGEAPDDLVSRLVDLIETLTGDRPGFRTVDAAKVALADALDDRRCLLVIDDAWRGQDLAPFLHRGPRDQTTRLVTTRDDGILPDDSTRVQVDGMTAGEAQQMLARGIPSAAARALRPRLVALGNRLGEWPLLLGLANGVVRARMARGAIAGDALTYVERAINQRGLARAFAASDRESRRHTASGTLEISLEQLSHNERVRFEELAVFAEDAEIPTKAAVGLWGQTAALDTLDGEDLLERLGQLSLLSDLDLGRGVLRLHDVVRTLLHEGPMNGRLAELHRHLIAYFRAASAGNLSDLDDDYGIRHLVTHLNDAGETNTARALLADPFWLANKLQRLGLQPLLGDYAALADRSALLGLISASLTLASPALARDARELAPQLLGRLAPGDADGMAEFLARTKRTISPTTLVPMRPTFTAPGAELRRFVGHRGPVNSVNLLLDGKCAISASTDRTMRLWDLETGAELRQLRGHEGGIYMTAMLPDGRRALSGSSDQTLRLWDLETAAELRRYDVAELRINDVTVLSDGCRAISASTAATLRLWHLDTGAELWRFEGHEHEVTTVTLLPDCRRLLSGSLDTTLRLWDIGTGAELRRFDGHESTVTDVVVVTNGQCALSSSHDQTLRLWDLDTGVELRRFAGHTDSVTSLAVLPDGRRAISGSWDRTLRLWDLETGAELSRYAGHEDAITAVMLLPDGRRALSASQDGTLRLWDLDAGVAQRRFSAHERSVSSVTVLADGQSALSGSWDRTLRLWDLATGAEQRRFEGHAEAVTSVTLLGDSRRALSGSYDQTLRLWDLMTGSELRRFDGHESYVSGVSVLPDERRALSGSWDDTMRLWDLETGAELRRLEGHQRGVSCVAVLPDGRHALSGAWDGILRLWDLNTGAEIRRFEGHETGVRSLTVLPDGQRALAGSEDGPMRLWELGTGAELRRYEGHQRTVRSIHSLADGRRALSASEDRTLRLWDLESGAEMARLTFDSTANAIASGASAQLIVGDGNGRLHVIQLID